MTSSRDFSGYPGGLPLPGLDLDFVETIPIIPLSGSVALNGAYLVRFTVPAPISFNTVVVGVIVQSGNIDGGIYEDTGATRSLIASSGSTAAADPGEDVCALQNLTLNRVANLVPGTTYYLAIAADNDTFQAASETTLAPISAMASRVMTKESTFPLPASLSGETVGAWNVPWLAVRTV